MINFRSYADEKMNKSFRNAIPAEGYGDLTNLRGILANPNRSINLITLITLITLT